MKQLGLWDLYRTLYPLSTGHTFLGAYGTFSGTDHTLGHKISQKTLKQIDIIQSIVSDHNELKLEISNRDKLAKWKLHMYTSVYKGESKENWVTHQNADTTSLNTILSRRQKLLGVGGTGYGRRLGKAPQTGVRLLRIFKSWSSAQMGVLQVRPAPSTRYAWGKTPSQMKMFRTTVNVCYKG